VSPAETMTMAVFGEPAPELDPEEVILSSSLSPDSVLLEVDGAGQVPEGLQSLSRRLPQTAIIACSQSRKPNFLLRAARPEMREFLT
jgi:hypothetical protein